MHNLHPILYLGGWLGTAFSIGGIGILSTASLAPMQGTGIMFPRKLRKVLVFLHSVCCRLERISAILPAVMDSL